MEKKKPTQDTPEKDNCPKAPEVPKEHGGPKGPEPTRYGDWTIGGKCVDF